MAIHLPHGFDAHWEERNGPQVGNLNSKIIWPKQLLKVGKLSPFLDLRFGFGLRTPNFSRLMIDSKCQHMRKKIYGLALGALLFAVTFPAQGQLPAKNVYRIAILSPATPPRPVIEALRRGLRDLGYTEAQNMFFWMLGTRTGSWNAFHN